MFYFCFAVSVYTASLPRTGLANTTKISILIWYSPNGAIIVDFTFFCSCVCASRHLSTTVASMDALQRATINSDFVSYNTFEPPHDKTYKKACATSEDSDMPTHSRSLIRVFADRMCLLQPSGYPKSNNENLCHTGCTGWSESLLVTQVLL